MGKQFKKYLLVSIIPLLFIIIFTFLKYSQGFSYNSYFYDPSYVYLINSLNIAQGVQAPFIYHPGTSLILIGAFVIKLIHLLFGNNPEIAFSVINTPESYLNSIYIFLTLLNGIGIFILGKTAYKIYGNYLTAWLFQLTPFLCTSLYLRITQLSPETFLIFCICIFIALTIKYVNSENLSSKQLVYFVIHFSLISGVMTVTKLTTLPLLIIPFILIPGLYRKLFFLLSTSIVFFALFAPFTKSINVFFQYVSDTIFKSGMYGKGESKIVDTSVYLNNLIKIISKEIFLDFVIILLIFALAVYFIYPIVNTFKQKNEIRLLIGILISIVANIVLTSKNFFQHYLIPSQMLMATALFYSVNTLKSKFAPRIKSSYLLTSILLVSIIYCSFHFIKFHTRMSDIRFESAETINFVNSNKDEAILIYSFGISDQNLALAYSFDYAGSIKKNYLSILYQKTPSRNLYFDLFTGRLSSLANYPVNDDIEMIREDLLSAKKIFFIKKDYISPRDPKELLIKTLKEKYNISNATLVEVFSNLNFESVYSVTINK